MAGKGMTPVDILAREMRCGYYGLSNDTCDQLGYSWHEWLDSAEEVWAELSAPLLRALHDAINRPKGVVPESAEPFYDPVRYSC